MSTITDLVETELRKAGPDGLGKQELQEATALGTDDLRAGITDLVTDGRVAERGAKFVHGELLDEPPTREMAAVTGEEEDGDDGEEPAVADLHGFRVTFEMTGEFRSLNAQEAVADAKVLAEDAKDGVLSKSPTVKVGVANLVVTEFAERRVWPATD